MLENEVILVCYVVRQSPRIGSKMQYCYYDDRLLQFQTNLYFKYVSELIKYILIKVLPLVDVGQVVAAAGPLSRIVFFRPLML